MCSVAFTRSLRRRATALTTAAVLAVAAPPAQAAPYPEYPNDATDYDEPFRFSSQGGWMNDVNAPLYHNGTWEPGTHDATLFSGGGWGDHNNVTGLKTGPDAPILLHSSSGSLGIRAYADNGTVRVESLTFRRLGKAWTSAPSGPDQGVGMIKWNGTGKCVDRGAATATVNIWDCWNGTNQRWTFTAAGKIRIGDECLDQPGETVGNGAVLKTYPCWGGDNQRWIRVGANQYRTSWSQRCLDLAGGDATNGRRLQVWDCVGGPNQGWGMPTG
ncbi:ricin-type beta-trefoil lectin domain protein [Saccharothrix sp. S26]|uniref:ricin-type beta-trefoil lectin domain protein n=1 Tax=Saccharothrix sp. S26 TaxID=2907215 RepID=UPI001F2F0EC2|nr:ricin-type beta-trefoil lectin domain protein [Saccharothrix sp. S26]MCE6999029.1 ricin-type beta-trefoil lectin domain protein [Saccharothrix sp. S26]